MRNAMQQLRSEAGSVAIMWVLGMVGFLGFLAVVTEGGFIYFDRVNLQNAADAAALAGAQSLTVNESTAVANAQLWTTKNEDELTLNQAVVINGGTEIEVTLKKNAESLFSGSLGLSITEVSATANANLLTTVMDFEGLPEGMIVTQISDGFGISGEPLGGFTGISTPGELGAMIFDGLCNGGPSNQCTGGDADLYFPAQGNILIITEDGDTNDPDDDGSGGTFVFDFTNYGPGYVTVGSLVLLDTEEVGVVRLFDENGDEIGVQFLGAAGDGQSETVFLGDVPGVAVMTIQLGGSGAVDDIGYYNTTRLSK